MADFLFTIYLTWWLVCSVLNFGQLLLAEEDLFDETLSEIYGSEEDEEDHSLEEESLINEIEDKEEPFEDKKLLEEVSGSGSEKPKEDGPLGGNEEPLGYCAPYTGQVCRKYLNGSSLVYYNFTTDSPLVPINEQITEELWNELISSLFEPCR